MKKIKNTRVVGAAVITVVLACCQSLKPEGPEATITSVEPQTISSNSKTDTPLTISGDTFSVALLRDVGCGHGTAIATDDTYDVEFVSGEDESTVFYAAQVDWIDENTLEAWIDAGSLPPGKYSIRVIDPWGRPSQLLDAVEVVHSEGSGQFDSDSGSQSDLDTDSSSSTADIDTDTTTCSAPDTACETDSATWDSATLDSGSGEDTENDTDTGPSEEIACAYACKNASNSFDTLPWMIPDSTDSDDNVWDYGTDTESGGFWTTHIGERYKPCESARLTSPEINLSPCNGQKLDVEFTLDYDYDNPLQDGHKDGLAIEFYNGDSWKTVDLDQDPDWEIVEHSYSEDHTEECAEDPEIVNHKCLTGSSDGWTKKVFRLEWDVFPSEFRFRLIHGSDYTANNDGTYFDAVDFRPVGP